MYWDLIIRDERKEAKLEGRIEGRIESILEMLAEKGDIPKDVEERILAEKDMDVLRAWNKLAGKSATVEEFIAHM